MEEYPKTSIKIAATANVLCEFDGDMSRVVSEPIYVQKVYDAVSCASAGHENGSESKSFAAGASMWTSVSKES